VVLLPVLLAAIVYVSSTAGRAVIDYDEGYYAQAAKRMFESGDWVTPYANGVRFLEKPPLMYWMTALSFRTFGLSEFALRLPTASPSLRAADGHALMHGACGDRADSSRDSAQLSRPGLTCSRTLHDVWLALFNTCYAAFAGGVSGSGLFGLGAAILWLMQAVLQKPDRCSVPVGIIAVFSWCSVAARAHLLPGSYVRFCVPWHWLAAIRNQGSISSSVSNSALLHKREAFGSRHARTFGL
jgi:hypothetical protein